MNYRRVILSFVLMLLLASTASAVALQVPASWDANGWWVDTGLDLKAGELIRVSASGQWAAAEKMHDADGMTAMKWPDQFMNPYGWEANQVNGNLGRLIGYIGDSPPAIGSFKDMPVPQRQSFIRRMALLGTNVVVRAPQAGRLFLGMNDDAYLANTSDKRGSLTVAVVRPEALPISRSAMAKQHGLSSRWHAESAGGVRVRLRRGRAWITFPPAVGGTSIRGDCRSPWTLTGDFDIQVDYRLLRWPKDNGVKLGLCTTDGTLRASGPVEGLGRTSFDGYISTSKWYRSGLQRTSDRSGTLRQTRKSGQLYSYYFDRQLRGWVQIGDPAPSTGEVALVLSAWAHDSALSHQYVRVAFSDFRRNSGHTRSEAPAFRH